MPKEDFTQLMNGLKADLAQYDGLKAYLEDNNGLSHIASLSIEQMAKVIHQIEGLKAAYDQVIIKLEQLAQTGGKERTYKNHIRKLESERQTWTIHWYKVDALRRAKSENRNRVYKPELDESNTSEAGPIFNAASPFIGYHQSTAKASNAAEAHAAREAVLNRSPAIQKVEGDMVALANIFEDMNVLVKKQEQIVVNMDENFQQVTVDAEKAVPVLHEAVEKAKAARKKKWILFGVAVALIIVIAAVLTVVLYPKSK